MPIEEQLARFERSLDDFARCVGVLDQGSFTKEINRWSARDILAHLIGWNRYVVEGSKQIKTGELPFYDVDPGENYSKVNAILIRECPSENRMELLDELRTSAKELIEVLRSLDPGDWARDYGVRNKGTVVTIRGTVDELIADYAHHRDQIVDWASGPGARQKRVRDEVC